MRRPSRPNLRPLLRLARATTNLASATTSAAGALAGAAVEGTLGAMRGGVGGAAHGVTSDIKDGSHSTAAALLAIGAIGVSGVVDWPILLGAGGAALILDNLNRQRAARVDPRRPVANSTPAHSRAAG
jgi:hypothetical protein